MLPRLNLVYFNVLNVTAHSFLPVIWPSTFVRTHRTNPINVAYAKSPSPILEVWAHIFAFIAAKNRIAVASVRRHSHNHLVWWFTCGHMQPRSNFNVKYAKKGLWTRVVWSCIWSHIVKKIRLPVITVTNDSKRILCSPNISWSTRTLTCINVRSVEKHSNNLRN